MKDPTHLRDGEQRRGKEGKPSAGSPVHLHGESDRLSDGLPRSASLWPKPGTQAMTEALGLPLRRVDAMCVSRVFLGNPVFG